MNAPNGNPPGQWQPPPQQGSWGQPAPAAPQQGYPQQGYPNPAQPMGAAPQYPGAGGPAAPQYQQPPAGGAYPQQGPQAQAYGSPPPGYPAPLPGTGYPQQQQSPFGGNPFSGMNSGEQIRSLPMLGGDKDGPIIEGDYKITLNLVKYKAKFQNSGGQAIIVEMHIDESNQPLRPAGSGASVFLMQGMAMSGINTTAFLSAAHGYDPLDLPKGSIAAPWIDQRAGRPLTWEEYAIEAIGQDNPWAGRKIGVSIVDIAKKDGGRFGRVDWKPIQTMVVAPRTFAPSAPAMPAPLPFNPAAPPQTSWQQPAGPQFAPPGQPPQQYPQQPQGGPPAWPQQQQAPQQPQGGPPAWPQQQQPPQQQAPQGYPQQKPPGSWGQPPQR